MTETSHSHDDAALLRNAWSEAQTPILERVVSFRRLLQGKSGARNSSQLAREAHRLAGTLGCFGLYRGSRMARMVEALLHEQAPAEILVEHLAALHQELQKAEPVSAPWPAVPPVALLVRSFVPQLLAFGDNMGLDFIPLEDLGGLIGKQWSLLVLDLSHPESENVPATLSFPTIGLLSEGSARERAAAQRGGVESLCPDIEHLCRTLGDYLS